jgi:hypothetical protein
MKTETASVRDYPRHLTWAGILLPVGVAVALLWSGATDVQVATVAGRVASPGVGRVGSGVGYAPGLGAGAPGVGVLPHGYYAAVPAGYVTRTYMGYSCRYVGGVYYRPVMYQGATVWVIV